MNDVPSAPDSGLDALNQDTDQTGNLPLTPPTVGGGATIFQRLSASNSPYLKALSSSTTNALKANPQAASQPGGWARALVGGAVEALGGGLGDASAIGTVPSGGGALTGIARTLAARNQRQRQQRLDQSDLEKNHQLYLESNLRMVNEQKLRHKTDNDSITAGAIAGQQQLAVMRNQANPAQIIKDNMTSDEVFAEMKAQIAKDPKLAGELTAVQNGATDIGDQDGMPTKRGSYALVRFNPVDLDPNRSEDKQVLDRLNKFSPPAPGKTWQGEKNGIVHFDGPRYNQINQLASDNDAAQRARQKILDDNEIEDTKRAVEIEAINIRPEIVNALANNANDPIKAYNALTSAKNQDGTPKFPNIQQDFKQYYGDKEWTELQEKHEQKVDQSLANFDEFNKKALTASSDEAASMAAAAQTQADKAPDVATKQKWLGVKTQLENQAQAGVDQTRKKKDAETAAEAGDLSGVAKLIINDRDISSIKDITSYRGNQRSKLFQEIAKQAKAEGKDPKNYSPAKLDLMAKTLTDYGEGKKADQITSYDIFLGHAGELSDVNQDWQRTNSPLLNKPLSWLEKNATNNPNYTKFVTALAPVQKEYMSFLNANRAEHESDIKLMDDVVLNKNSTPLQIQTALAQLGSIAQIRANELGDQFKRAMNGDSFDYYFNRSMLSSGAQNGLSKLGLAAPQVGQTKKFPNGRIGKWDGKGWVAQPTPTVQ